jgi:hypothetical protein
LLNEQAEVGFSVSKLPQKRRRWDGRERQQLLKVADTRNRKKGAEEEAPTHRYFSSLLLVCSLLTFFSGTMSGDTFHTTNTKENSPEDGVPPIYLGGGVTPHFVVVHYNQPHWKRKKLMLQRDPEITKLFKPYPLSALCIVAIVLLQTAIAFLISTSGYNFAFISSSSPLFISSYRCTVQHKKSK